MDLLELFSQDYQITLEENNVKTYKISFPLYEYGFPKSRLIKFHQDIYLFKKFLRKILKKKIKHIFMYGNVFIPHRESLDLVKELKKEDNKLRPIFLNLVI